MKILFVAGTRPEIIKIAPLLKYLGATDAINVKLCVTGQHREMLDQMLDIFELQPDFDLQLMQKNQTLNNLCAGVFTKLPAVISSYSPDWVIVQGDTTTAAMAAIAAFNAKIKIIHLEAGLRSYDINLPWPEEGNRKLIGSIANLHLAPTELAKQNLLNEKVPEGNIVVTGNTVVDALYWMQAKISCDQELQHDLNSRFLFLDQQKKTILVTGHRRESFGQGHANIFQALQKLAERKDIEIVYPVHLNPNVKQQAEKLLANVDNIFLIPPVDYPSLVYLLDRCYLVVTDSGGLQEEAPSFAKPVVVTRDVTERVEGVEAGTAVLVGTKTNLLVRVVEKLLTDKIYYDSFALQGNPYGDGKAAERIYASLRNEEVCCA